MTKQRIFLGVPVVNSMMNANLARAVYRVVRQQASEPDFPYDIDFWTVSNYRPVEYARNTLVGEMLRATPAYDALWFIDADMEPCSNWLDLLKCDADIAVGLTPMMPAPRDGRRFVAYSLFNRPPGGKPLTLCDIPMNQRYIEADASGAACMIIKRKVLEDKKMWLGEQVEEACAPLFQSRFRHDGKLLGGEDVDFCLRAKDLGYTLRCDTEVIFDHRKELGLNTVMQVFEGAYTRGVEHGQMVARLEALHRTGKRIIQ